MAEIRPNQFSEYFQALHQKRPFPWQEALAAEVCEAGWPDVISLPTSSGKTACIDIALFALAVGDNEAPRRIFFVVDRRVVVNEAYERMKKVRAALKTANSGTLLQVAERLREVARGTQDPKAGMQDDPLFVAEMRGGAYRDETWVRNPLQPTVVASTVDQVGSRLLFRGYGVSDHSWPLHAGLIANDALIFLDEAHCSLAFAQTLQEVKRYRGAEWAKEPLHLPFHFVEMTATPSERATPARTFTLGDKDRNDEVLGQRLRASKPTRLVEITARKEDTEKLVGELVSQALALSKAADARRVIIFVNRVKTAKAAYKSLCQQMEHSADVQLVIGRMRPWDREQMLKHHWDKLKSDNKREPNDRLTFVVSTQCLEVGADLDFDVLVTECASADALLQRFGRLNRLGAFERARGAIVIGSWQVSPRRPDPVYRESLPETWKWLTEIAGDSGFVDMGIESAAAQPTTAKEHLDRVDKARRKALCLAAGDAPVLMPAHIDMLAQTSPPPEPEPLIELFLHGLDRGVPEVQVIWRADLEYAQTEEEEMKIIALCPPSSAEAMPVTIRAFCKWFAGETDFNESESDLEIGVQSEETRQQRRTKIHALLWEKDKCRRVWDANEIKPGQTLILKTSDEGWDALGYIPEGSPKDIGDCAALTSRASVSLRFHQAIMKDWAQTPALAAICDYLKSADVGFDELKVYLQSYRDEISLDSTWPRPFLGKLEEIRRPELEVYPGEIPILALRARLPIGKKSGSKERIYLEDHLRAVETVTELTTAYLPANLGSALKTAAHLHDYGKVDIRYQAWLRGGDLLSARYAPKPIGKSGKDVLRPQASVGLPEGFRHELLSLIFAEKSPRLSEGQQDLVLHLIASHHGRCRPLAPVIIDGEPACASFNGITVCGDERAQRAPHHIGNGVPDRFWQLTAKYGWWGLAYLEALLRLADWRASTEEAAEVE